jgi:hypothetical protein
MHDLAVARSLRSVIHAVVADDEADVEHYRWRVSKNLTRRIDQYLVDRIGYLSRAGVQRVIADGLVKVNGRVVPLRTMLENGDQVEIMTSKTGEPRRDWLLAANGFLASGRARDKVRAWFHAIDMQVHMTIGENTAEAELQSCVHYGELGQWAPCIVDTRNAMAGVPTTVGTIWKA